jgi:hypothetical protein
MNVIPVRKATTKKKKKSTNANQRCKKKEGLELTPLARMDINAATMEMNMGVSLQTKNRNTLRSC